ncbi:recombination protein O N-terminal domain-containing protein [Mycoplasma hafezii]|uniref:recombination protein O N-terminal domain-containing protein n=1 Tax=Mycoplasma hafezii TaxID=525886 RepID=UPI003CF4D8B9
MAESIQKAIVLNIHEDSENLFIVSFFTKNGILKLAAQGLNKPLSKNRVNLQIGALVEVEYFAARLSGKTGKLKKSHLISSINIDELKNAEFADKYVKLLANIQAPNHVFEQCLEIYDLISPLTGNKILTFLYAQSLIYFGLCPNFTSCHLCLNERNLIHFNLNEGGFVCNRHEGVEVQSIEFLQAVWYSFHSLKQYLIVVSNTTNLHVLRMYQALIRDNGYYI